MWEEQFERPLDSCITFANEIDLAFPATTEVIENFEASGNYPTRSEAKGFYSRFCHLVECRFLKLWIMATVQHLTSRNISSSQRTCWQQISQSATIVDREEEFMTSESTDASASSPVQGSPPGAAEAAPESSMRRLATTALAGTSIEWYDFFLYGTAAALVFPRLFFPADMPPLVALLASFSTFAVGFLARPIGGILFGHFGDRAGRKAALVTALLMMGGATTLIGALPSYETVGAAAPLMLVILRFIQGLAIGGQWGGAMLLVTESAPANKRGFYGAFAQAGAPVGVILANLAFLLVSTNLSEADFMSWGWRLPFLASVILIGLSIYVQLRLEDTPAFRQLQKLKTRNDQVAIEAMADKVSSTTAISAATVEVDSRRSPVLEAIRLYPRQIVLAAGAFLAVQVTFYILIAFVIAYGSNPETLNLPRDTMLWAVLIGSIVQIPVLFASAAWSDRHGRRGIYMLGAVLGGLWAFCLFPLIDTGSFLWIVVGIGGGQAFLSMMYGPQAAFLAELFATHVRYSGVSLGYQLGAIVGGALAPVIATALLAEFGNTVYISAYMALASALTLISVIMLSETYKNDLHSQ